MQKFSRMGRCQVGVGGVDLNGQTCRGAVGG